MINPKHLQHAFDGEFPRLRTNMAGEELLLTRISHAPGNGMLELTAPPQDAFALVFQLKPVPEHAITIDGQRFAILPGPAHTITAIDLACPIVAQSENAFDSLNVNRRRTGTSYRRLKGTPL